MTDQPTVVDVDEQPIVIVAGRVAMAEIRTFFDEGFQTLGRFLAESGVQPTGAAFARYPSMPGEVMDIELGFPVAAPIEPSGDVQASTLPAGRVARAIHVGGFDGLPGSWEALGAWIAAEGHTPGAGIWEVYLVEPTPDMDPAELRTELNWPLVSAG